MFNKGFLPNGNGWLEQSNKYIEVMLFIENILAKHSKEQREKKNG